MHQLINSPEKDILAYMDRGVSLDNDEVLTFPIDKEKFAKYLCCGPQGWSYGLAFMQVLFVPCLPIKLCCPWWLVKYYSMELHHDVIVYNSAQNDCCFHIAKSRQSIPLDKVNDVQLQTGCWETCFGLKVVDVDTSGFQDAKAACLAAPDLTREAILLASRQFREKMMPPGSAAGMTRDKGGGGGGGAMGDRLVRLNLLVEKGVLSSGDASRLKAAILTAPVDPTVRLFEAHALLKRDLISTHEFETIKEAVIAQIPGA